MSVEDNPTGKQLGILHIEGFADKYLVLDVKTTGKPVMLGYWQIV